MCDKTSDELWEDWEWAEGWATRLNVAEQHYQEAKTKFQQAVFDASVSLDTVEFLRKEKDYAMETVTTLHQERRREQLKFEGK